MKYDDLEAFREYLYAYIENANTARKYYSAVKKLFSDVSIGDIKTLGVDFYEAEIPRKFKTKNEVSAAKNGLKYFKEYFQITKIPGDTFYREVSQKKRNRSVKPKKEIPLDEVKRKTNQIKDVKYKYAYRLAMVSGLRVSELADVSADKLRFQDGTIYVHVTNGKGGSNGVVECMQDKYLYERLQEYASENPEGPLFYSESTLRKKAWKLGMECHDFRRIFSITLREELKKKMPVEEANQIVQDRMRHKRFSTTKRYLFNKKLIIK